MSRITRSGRDPDGPDVRATPRRPGGRDRDRRRASVAGARVAAHAAARDRRSLEGRLLMAPSVAGAGPRTASALPRAAHGIRRPRRARCRPPAVVDGDVPAQSRALERWPRAPRRARRAPPGPRGPRRATGMSRSSAPRGSGSRRRAGTGPRGGSRTGTRERPPVAQRGDIVAAVVVDDQQPATRSQDAVDLGEVGRLDAPEAGPQGHDGIERGILRRQAERRRPAGWRAA